MRKDRIACTIDNEIEARLVSALLDESGIPHFMRSFHDSAYDGIFQAQLGWGHIEADPKYHEQINQIVEDVRTREG
jgi:hypothetical protein